MVAFRRSSPFNHRHFSLRPRIVPAHSVSLSPRESESEDQDSKLSKERNSTYPIYVVAAFLVILLLVSSFNALHRLTLFAAKVRKRERSPSRRTLTRNDSKLSPDKSYRVYEHGPSFTRGQSVPPKPSFLRRLSVAFLNALRIVAFRKTRIPLFKLFIGSLCFLLPFAFFLINIKDVEGKYDVIYWANRAGALAVAQLAFVVALAQKNSFVGALTGFAVERLNFLHRISGRTVCLLLWIHMCGHITTGFTEESSFTQPFMRAGALAITSLTLTVLIGVRPLRQKVYEWFLSSHILLILIFLLAGIGHVSASPYFLPYFIPPLVLWLVDRLIRLFRLITLRVLSRRPIPVSLEGSLDAIANPQTSSPAYVIPFVDGAVGVFVRMPSAKRPQSRWKAGQFAFLSIPAVSQLGVSLEAHPFSIAAVDTPLRSFLSQGQVRNGLWHGVPGSDGASSSSPSQYSFEASKSEGEKRVREGTDLASISESESIFMRFIVHPRNGFTRRLREFSEDISAGGQISAFVDGPYGCPPDISAYEKVVLIAGGSGITFILPLLLDMTRRAKLTPTTTVCRLVQVIWTVRDPRQVDWLREELHLLQSSQLPLLVKIRLYCSRESWSINQMHQEPEMRPSYGYRLQTDPGQSSYAQTPVSLYPTTLAGRTFNNTGPHEVLPYTTAPPLTGHLEDIPISPVEYETHSRAYSSLEGEQHRRIGSARGMPAHVTRFSGRPDFEDIFKGKESPLRDGGDVAVCVSGPGSLIESVRMTLGSWDLAGPGRVSRGGANVFLHVERFGF